MFEKRCHYCFQSIEKDEDMICIHKTTFDVYDNEYLSGNCYYHKHCYEEEQRQILNYEEKQKEEELKVAKNLKKYAKKWRIKDGKKKG